MIERKQNKTVKEKVLLEFEKKFLIYSTHLTFMFIMT